MDLCQELQNMADEARVDRRDREAAEAGRRQREGMSAIVN